MSSHDSTDRQSVVQGLVAALSESGNKSVPMATTDAEEVIKTQLTENTGRHLLDSGSAYGRHWEENQDNPPWEQPEYNVNDGWVTTNLYHYMDRRLGRDSTCISLEAALYAYSYSDDRKRDAWLRCQEDFADGLLSGDFTRPQLRTLGLEGEVVEDVLGLQRELRSGRGESSAMTHNTYNGEFQTLSQCLQGTNVGGPYAEYVFMQVHGGCDIRGGYTAPRVYSVWDAWLPGELSYYCPDCGWTEAESVAGYDCEQLLFQRTIDHAELHDALAERSPDHATDDDIEARVREVAEQAESENTDGAVFHIADGCGGVVRY